MTEPIQHKRQLRFGDFQADLQSGELRKNGHCLRLQEKPLQLLTILLERPGRVVSKDELQQRLWPDVQVDAEAGLTEAAYKLRQTLGDSAKTPRYIETLPKRGYRFIAPVDTGEDQTAEVTSSAVATHSEAVSKNQLRAYQGMLLLTVLSCMALAFMKIEPEPTQQPLRRFSIQPPGEIESHAVGQPAATISPNGRFIAFVAGTERQLWVQDLQQDVLREVADAQHVWSPFWSPDSAFILFGSKSARGRAVQKVPVDGGTVSAICEFRGPNFYQGTVSNDGQTVVFASGSGYQALWEAPFAGGVPKEVFSPAEKEEISAQYSQGGVVSIGTTPRFLPSEPDERILVFGVGMSDSPAQRMMIFDLNSRQRQVLTQGRDPVYSPTGHLMFSSGRNPRALWAMPFSLETLEPTGEPFLVRENTQNPSVSQDGTLTYLDWADNPNQLVWRDRNGNKLDSLGPGQRPQISPDGSRVAYNRDGNILVRDLATGMEVEVTSEQAGDFRPIWHPDERRLFFASSRTGNVDIWKVELDRIGREPKIAFSSASLEIPNDVTPDGRVVYHQVSEAPPRLDLSYLQYDGDSSTWISKVFLAGRSGGGEANVSPNGKWIAYQTTVSGAQEVYVERFPDGGDQHPVSTSPGRAIQGHWRGDGRELFFIGGRGRNAAMYAVPVSGEDHLVFGKPKRLFPCGLAYYDVSADGQQFLVSEPREAHPKLKIHIVQNWYEEFRDRTPN